MKNKLNKLISSGVFKDVSFLDNYNFANLFNVVNKGEKSYFNLCRSIYFDIEDIDGDFIATTDTDNAIVAGNPAKIIKYRQ